MIVASGRNIDLQGVIKGGNKTFAIYSNDNLKVAEFNPNICALNLATVKDVISSKSSRLINYFMNNNQHYMLCWQLFGLHLGISLLEINPNDGFSILNNKTILDPTIKGLFYGTAHYVKIKNKSFIYANADNDKYFLEFGFGADNKETLPESKFTITKSTFEGRYFSIGTTDQDKRHFVAVRESDKTIQLYEIGLDETGKIKIMNTKKLLSDSTDLLSAFSMNNKAYIVQKHADMVKIIQINNAGNPDASIGIQTDLFKDTGGCKYIYVPYLNSHFLIYDGRVDHFGSYMVKLNPNDGTIIADSNITDVSLNPNPLKMVFDRQMLGAFYFNLDPAIAPN